MSISISISERVRRIVERLGIDIFQISSVVRANPAQVFIMSNVWKRKSEPCIAGEVPSFITVDVALVNLGREKSRSENSCSE